MVSTTADREPFGWQLTEPGYVLDLRQASGRAAESGPGPRPAGDAEPCVLLVSRAADAELDAVLRLLVSIGVPVLRINAEAAASSGLAVDLSRPGQPALRYRERWITPTVTWVRHFSARAMPTPARAAPASGLFAQDSWQALAGQLSAVSAITIGQDGPGLLTQLAMARALGIAIPRTVVTTDLALATDRLASATVVIKALHSHFVEASPGLLTGAFPELTARSGLRQPDRAGGPPLVVQEYVEHEQEIRAYYARGEMLGFAVVKSDPAQPWLRPDLVSVRPVELPQPIAAATAALARSLALEYGAFDFLVASGVPVFLEVNLAGDWRWLERRAGTTAVAEAVARMLRDLHAQALPGRTGVAASPPVRRRGGLPLTTFLAGGRLAGSGDP